jgi:tripartite-type tricarboxylate transporter receptor subunit TctC
MTNKNWRTPAPCMRVAAWALALAGAVGVAGGAQAQATDDWPNHPIKVIVPYTPGGSTDVVTRTVMDKLSQRLKQTIIVENRPGANGTVGTGAGARAPADGYNFVSVLAAHAINPSLYASLPYKPTDLVPISHMADLVLFLFVNKDVPANTVAELVAYGRKNPGKLNYASSGTGSSAHLTGVNFGLVSGMEMTHIPYKGSAPILSDLVGGQLSMVFDPILVPMPHVKTGKLKVLAVTSSQRWPDEPGVPTMEESGYPGFVMSSWAGLMAPAGTPQVVIDRMSREINEIVQLPDVKAAFKNAGFLPAGGTPAQFQELIAKDQARYAEIIKKAGVTVQ